MFGPKRGPECHEQLGYEIVRFNLSRVSADFETKSWREKKWVEDEVANYAIEVKSTIDERED
jgi:hypothetical protein